jgi:hypothetical protein
VRDAARNHLGGYSGVFNDHIWEVAHNPRWTIADDRSVTLA